MTNVVLVGAGKLGSRHLQAISQARLKNLKIFVVDFNPEAITNSKKRLAVSYTHLTLPTSVLV